jgi:hypothetical protein
MNKEITDPPSAAVATDHADCGTADGLAQGGPVFLEWFCSPPRWLSLEGRYALAPLAGFNPGAEAAELTEPPFGTNMAFRRTMFDKYGSFRTDLGPSPDGGIPNEDTEFGLRLIAGGSDCDMSPLLSFTIRFRRIAFGKDTF